MRWVWDGWGGKRVCTPICEIVLAHVATIHLSSFGPTKDAAIIQPGSPVPTHSTHDPITVLNARTHACCPRAKCQAGAPRDERKTTTSDTNTQVVPPNQRPEPWLNNGQPAQCCATAPRHCHCDITNRQIAEQKHREEQVTSSTSILVQETNSLIDHGRRRPLARIRQVPGARASSWGLSQDPPAGGGGGGGGEVGWGERPQGEERRRRPGVVVLAEAGGAQGREAGQGAGDVRVRDQRARPREPRLPPPQRQADGERPRRSRPLHQQAVQRQPGQAAGDLRGDLHPDPARAGAQRRPLRGHLQLLLRRLRPHLRAGPVPHLRGVLPRRHRRLRRLRGRLRPGQAQPDRLPLQDLLHLLPQGHPRPAAGAALHARPAVPDRRANAGRQGHRAPRLPQQLHQLAQLVAHHFRLTFNYYFSTLSIIQGDADQAV